MRSRRLLVALVPILAFSHALAAQSNGATERFGRGIAQIADNGTTVKLDLRAEAHGLLLRVAEHKPVVVVRAGEFPAGQSVVTLPAREVEMARVTTSGGGGGVYSSDPARAERDNRMARRNCEGTSAGLDRLTIAMRHAECQGVRVAAWQPTTTTTLPRAPSREYLILVVSDLPLDTADVLARLATLPRFEPATGAHDVAQHLVGQRSSAWAGYIVRR